MVIAEEGGFEPPVQFPVRQFSKLLVSATHPSLQGFWWCKFKNHFQSDNTFRENIVGINILNSFD